MEKELIINSQSDWYLVSNFILENIEDSNLATVITLEGDLGAGKTTFVQSLAKSLGVKEMVNSPTFTIIKSYEIENFKNFRHLVHMDAYRIDDMSELKPLHFEEILKSKGVIVCIEWAKKIQSTLPSKVWSINITNHKDGGRMVKIAY